MEEDEVGGRGWRGWDGERQASCGLRARAHLADGGGLHGRGTVEGREAAVACLPREVSRRQLQRLRDNGPHTVRADHQAAGQLLAAGEAHDGVVLREGRHAGDRAVANQALRVIDLHARHRRIQHHLLRRQLLVQQLRGRGGSVCMDREGATLGRMHLLQARALDADELVRAARALGEVELPQHLTAVAAQAHRVQAVELTAHGVAHVCAGEGLGGRV